MATKSTVDRFMKHVSPEPNSGCWLWAGGHLRMGYGQFRYESRTRSAHRVSYLLFKSPIPDGLVVMHTCDVMSCVNPDHLVIGTYSDNTKDSISKGRNYPLRVKRGEDIWCAKLTPEEVGIIRLSSDSQRKLAKTFGVSQKLVNLIKLNKIWRWVK